MEDKKKTMSKSQLVKELSWKAGVSQAKVKEMLEALKEIAQRETANTFILPGLCKLESVRRKARKLRNPRTGEVLMMPERNAVRIVAARAVKIAVAGHVTALPLAEYERLYAPPAPEPPPAPAPEPVAVTEPKPEPHSVPDGKPAKDVSTDVSSVPVAADAVQAAPSSPLQEISRPEPPPRPEPQPVPPPKVDPGKLISFRCPRCHQEVEATGDMVGIEAECPTCGAMMRVPAESEKGTVHGEPDGSTAPTAAQVVSEREAETLDPYQLKSRTIRINAQAMGFDDAPPALHMISFCCPHCHQEVEASSDLVGETVECPSCQSPLKVPAESMPHTLHAPETDDARELNAMKGRTMRIDLPDNF